MNRLYIIMAFLCALLSGCITFEQTLKIRSNDTLVAEYSYTFKKAQQEAARAAMQEFSSGASFLDEKAVRDFFASRNAEMTSYKRQERNDLVHIQIIVIASDYRKAISAGAFGGMRLAYEEGVTRLEIPLSSKAEREKFRARTAKLCPGASASLTVSTPRDITLTNGKEINDEMCTWNFTSDGKDSFFDAPDVLFVQWKSRK